MCSSDLLFPDNSGSAVTVTNNYGLLINDQTANTGTVTYTNRWGIYQEGASDTNYFAATTLVGTTVNAGYKLDVNGTGRFSGNILTNGGTVAALNAGSIEVYNAGNSNFFDLKSTGGNFALRTNVGVGAVNALTISSSGQAQFSTSLSVNGSLDSTGAKANIYGGLIIYEGAISTPPTAASLVIDQQLGGIARIMSSGVSTWNVPLAINPYGGNALIGTTTDSGYKLQVNGTSYIYGSGSGPFNAQLILSNLTSSPTLIQLANSSNSFAFGLNTTGTQRFVFINGGLTEIANINGATGVYTALSDFNKKKDFEYSTIGLDSILKLKPTLYRMKTDDENTQKQLGFIAQEVKEVIPQAFVQNDDFIGLNYNAIIAALVKAVQELNEKIK